MEEEQAERFVEENQSWLIPLAILGLCVVSFLFGCAVATGFFYLSH